MNHWGGIGRLTRDPEIRYTSSGKAVARFNLAIDRRRSGDAEKQVDFVPCVAWEKTAEVIGNHCTKGQKIAAEGRIQTRSYEKDGRKVYVTEVVVTYMEFCDSKGSGTNSAAPPEQQGVFDGSRAVADSDIPF